MSIAPLGRVASAVLMVSLAAGAGLTGSQASAQPATARAVALIALPQAVGPQRKGPPAGTLRVNSRYLTHYGAKRASWSDVINHGARLPKVGARCKQEWRSSGKDQRLSWASAQYLCLDQLRWRGSFRPQGIGGSASTRRYKIGAKSARSRNLILTSWYSRAREPGLFAPNRARQSVTRLVVMDLSKRRYSNVELVRPSGRNQLRNLNSHGSGLVWAGQYLYVSSRSVLWVFNADDIVNIRGHYVLPAVARWTVQGLGGMSSLSIDRSTSPDRLMTINYTKRRPTYIQEFALKSNGLLAARRTPTTRDMLLRNRWGEQGRVVHSTRSAMISGASYQGVAAVGRFSFASSSSLRTDKSGTRKVDAMAVFRDGRLAARFQMPRGNVESIFIDYKRNRYVSLTEGGSQFLFSLPYRSITHNRIVTR